MIKFQYFSNKVKDAKPRGFISIEQFIQGHLNPRGELKAIFEVIESANDKYKAFLKQNYLAYFTPCVKLNNGRKYTDIYEWTGLLVLDFDKIDHAEQLKQNFFSNYPWVITAYLSPSGKGFKALVSIPVCKSTDEFKERFYALSLLIKDHYPGFDSTSKNCVLPLFQSYDPNLLHRFDPDAPPVATFTGREVVPDAFVPSTVAPIKVNITDRDLRSVHNIITSSINKITSDGHPQVRGTSITLGGYVASGYISQHDAESLIDNLIRSNGYLAKGIAGYISTSKWAIKQGMNNQLILE